MSQDVRALTYSQGFQGYIWLQLVVEYLVHLLKYLIILRCLYLVGYFSFTRLYSFSNYIWEGLCSIIGIQGWKLLIISTQISLIKSLFGYLYHCAEQSRSWE